MKFYHLLLLLLLPGAIFAQIGREFVHKKLKGDVSQSRTKTFMDVLLDEKGMPILDTEPSDVTDQFYKDGYPVDMQSFDIEYNKEKLSIRFLLERQGADIQKVEIFTYSTGMEDLLRAHEAYYVDGKLAFENITDDHSKLLGTAKYKQGKTPSGNDFTLMEAKGNRAGSYNIYRESGKKGEILSIEYTPLDTLKITKSLELQGDTLEKLLIITKKRSGTGRDSALATLRHWLDEKGNPTLTLQTINLLTSYEQAEKRVMYAATTHVYRYGDSPGKKAEVLPKMEQINGAWRNESDNIQLIISPVDGTGKRGFICYSLRGSPPNGALIEVEDGWKEDLKKPQFPGTWNYDESTGLLELNYGNAGKLILQAKMELNTLILLPAEAGQFKPLRLVKNK